MLPNFDTFHALTEPGAAIRETVILPKHVLLANGGVV
jgi:hypothetical protein